MSGAATYIAEGWSEEIDNFMRDLIANKKLNKIQISLIEGEAARKLGAVHLELYRREIRANNISHILNRTRVIRNVQQLSLVHWEYLTSNLSPTGKITTSNSMMK